MPPAHSPAGYEVVLTDWEVLGLLKACALPAVDDPQVKNLVLRVDVLLVILIHYAPVVIEAVAGRGPGCCCGCSCSRSSCYSCWRRYRRQDCKTSDKEQAGATG